MVSSQGNNWRKILEKRFSLFSYTELKIQGLLTGKNCHVRQNCLLLLKRNILREKALFRYFQDLESKTTQLSARKMGRLCRNCIVLARGAIWRKQTFLMKTSCVIFLNSDIQRTDLVFLRKTSAWLSKLNSISPQEFF